MKELLVNNLSTVDYKIYLNGVATDADSLPTAVAYLNGSTTGVTLSVATSSTGKYTAILPMSMTASEGSVSVQWSFSLQSNSATFSEEYVVVTPYAPWSYFETTATYSDYLECERIARKLIESYTGQYFGKIATTYTVDGIDTNGLRLPRRLLSVTEVRWLDQYTNPTIITAPSPSDGWNEYDWEVAANGWILRTPRSRKRIDMAFPVKYSFTRNTSYDVEGVWGYSSVPTAVEEAAKIIIANLLCKDQKYRDKYLKSVATNDWDLEFMEDAFRGTGSVNADQLLNEYRLYPGVGIV